MIIKSELNKKYLVPDVAAIAREMTGNSQIMIIIKRFLSLNLLSKFKLMFNNIKFLPDLAKMDFAVGIKVLCELEILKKMEKQKIKQFVLHSQMVDMSLSLKNKKVIENFFYLSKKYDFIPGIMTYNTEFLIKMLSGFKKIPKKLFIYTPIKKDSFIYDFLKKSSLKFINITND